jgi:hypothetical protein
MKVLIWLANGTWESAVDAVAGLPADEVTLLHVADPAVAGGAHGAWAGLVGRGGRHDPARRWRRPPTRRNAICGPRPRPGWAARRAP